MSKEQHSHSFLGFHVNNFTTSVCLLKGTVLQYFYKCAAGLSQLHSHNFARQVKTKCDFVCLRGRLKPIATFMVLTHFATF